MKRFTLALGAAGLATALAGAAWANQHGMPGMGGGRGHDPFGNATITRAEAQAKAAEMFTRHDVNRDGKLDPADRTAAMGARFDAMDANHDGALSKQEFMDAHGKMMGGRGGPDDARGPEGHSGEGHRMGAGMGNRMGGMKMLGQMDANGDRAITRDEFLAGALKRFDAADANRDGKLTPEERRAAMQAGMKRHMQHKGGMGHDMSGHEKAQTTPAQPK